MKKKLVLLVSVMIFLTATGFAQKAGEELVKAGKAAAESSKKAVRTVEKTAKKVANENKVVKQGFKDVTVPEVEVRTRKGTRSAFGPVYNSKVDAAVLSKKAEEAQAAADLSGKLIDFCALNNRYPKGVFFDESGKEITLDQLSAEQLAEKQLYNDIENALQTIPGNPNVEKMLRIKNTYATMQHAEKTYTQLEDFIVDNGFFPQIYPEAELDRFSGELRLEKQKESVLATEVWRLIYRAPDNTWVKQMIELRKMMEK